LFFFLLFFFFFFRLFFFFFFFCFVLNLALFSNKKGRVRTKTIKRSARQIVEKYYPRLTLDFDTNKRITDEVAVLPSKRLRNKIAGYVTHLMKRMQQGPVRGISIKLQEEERERRDNYVPDVSVIDQNTINIDADTKDMLRAMDFPNLKGINVVAVSAGATRPQRGERGDRPERSERAERGERPERRQAPTQAAAQQ
jgi:small subunit ribosomal protein S17e